MNLLDLVLNAQGGQAVRQLAQGFGVEESQASSAVTALLPALAAGLNRNVSQQGGVEQLLGALAKGNHGSFLDDLGLLGQPAAVQQGNGILGHLLGSKDVSRQVASQAASQTGLSEAVLKQMLPLVATMAMGALSKQASSTGLLGSGASAAPASGGALGMLAPLLDMNKDGSVADDVMRMVTGFLSKR